MLDHHCRVPMSKITQPFKKLLFIKKDIIIKFNETELNKICIDLSETTN